MRKFFLILIELYLIEEFPLKHANFRKLRRYVSIFEPDFDDIYIKSFASISAILKMLFYMHIPAKKMSSSKNTLKSTSSEKNAHFALGFSYYRRNAGRFESLFCEMWQTCFLTF